MKNTKEIPNIAYNLKSASVALSISEPILKEIIAEGQIRAMKLTGKGGRSIDKILIWEAELQRFCEASTLPLGREEDN